MDIPEEIAAAMQVQIDMWVSYVYRTSRKKEIRGDAAVGLLVRQGSEAIAPEGITRGMINAVRTYLANQHQVKHSNVTILNVVRLIPEVADVPSGGDGKIREGEIRQGAEELRVDMGAVPEVDGEPNSGGDDESDSVGVPPPPEDDGEAQGGE